MMLLTGKLSRRVSRRGFTLIELIIVMTLLAVVISVSAPRLATFFKGRKLNVETRRLMALTRFGQSRAVSEGIPMLLWVDEKSGEYGCEAESGYEDRPARLEEFDLGEDLKIEIQLTLGRENSAMRRTSHGQLPAIRFLPDGSIDETSPVGFELKEKSGPSLSLVLSENRTTYEVGNAPK